MCNEGALGASIFDCGQTTRIKPEINRIVERSATYFVHFAANDDVVGGKVYTADGSKEMVKPLCG